MCADVSCLLFFQVEADLGYPGGKAKIIHKESDIIMAFAINKVRFVRHKFKTISYVTEVITNVFFFPSSSQLLPYVQANSNEIVLASTHDVQEVDVSSLVAVQPFTWIGEDFDKESRR